MIKEFSLFRTVLFFFLQEFVIILLICKIRIVLQPY